MKLKYHVFLDRWQIVFTAMTVLFAYGVVVTLTDAEGGWYWLPAALVGILCGAIALTTPCLYIMSDKGITIIYMLGFLRRYIPWNTVRKLEICHHRSRRSIPLPYINDTIVIHGQAQGKQFFFTDNEIIRTRRARKLLESYTGFPVEGFMIDDLRARRRNRKEKQETERKRRERQARVERNREAKKTANKAAKNSPSRPTKK